MPQELECTCTAALCLLTHRTRQEQLSRKKNNALRKRVGGLSNECLTSHACATSPYLGIIQGTGYLTTKHFTHGSRDGYSLRAIVLGVSFVSERTHARMYARLHILKGDVTHLARSKDK